MAATDGSTASSSRCGLEEAGEPAVQVLLRLDDERRRTERSAGARRAPASCRAPRGAPIRCWRTAIITDIVIRIRSSTRSVATTTCARSPSTPAIASSKAACPSAGLMASSAAASIRLFLSGKTRKIVPSAMPAASGDLAGADVAALLDDERHEHVEDRLAAVVGAMAAARGARAAMSERHSQPD